MSLNTTLDLFDPIALLAWYLTRGMRMLHAWEFIGQGPTGNKLHSVLEEHQKKTSLPRY